jgi:hypothetical protein
MLIANHYDYIKHGGSIGRAFLDTKKANVNESQYSRTGRGIAYCWIHQLQTSIISPQLPSLVSFHINLSFTEN